MIRLLQMTAWHMNKPIPYGAFHLSFFVVGLFVSVILAYVLRKSGEKQNRIILIICGLLLLVSEIYKQLFYTFIIGEGIYQWWIFPFQMCSVPMYLCLIVTFLPEGRIQKGMYNFMLAFNLMGGFITFFEPSGILHEYWTLTIHAFCWHMLLVFIGLYIGFSKRAGLKVSDYKYGVGTFGVLCLIAFIINLIFWKQAGGDINMFYVGPQISPIVVFETISTKYGWYINTPIYMACICFAAFIFYLPFALFNRRKTA